jgi:hypothetical protein
MNKHITYQDVFVCEEWHNFQVFAKWFYENYYKILGEIMNLDKDIIKKGNKIYGPEYCAFVPQTINKLLVKTEMISAKDINCGLDVSALSNSSYILNI